MLFIYIKFLLICHLYDLELSSGFLDMMSKHKHKKKDKLDFIKIKMHLFLCWCWRGSAELLVMKSDKLDFIYHLKLLLQVQISSRNKLCNNHQDQRRVHLSWRCNTWSETRNLCLLNSFERALTNAVCSLCFLKN